MEIIVKQHKKYLKVLKKLLYVPMSRGELLQVVVDAPFSNRLEATKLDLGIVVLLLVNQTTNTVDRVALSRTEQALGAVRMSAKKFKDIKIPADFDENYIVKAINSGQPQQTDDWQHMFIPSLTAEQARFNQSGAGIESSTIYPLDVAGGGALIFSYYQPLQNIGALHHAFMREYATCVSEALEDFTL